MPNVFYCDGLFEESDLEFLRKEVDKTNATQSIIENRDIAKFIYEKCKDKLLEWDSTIKHYFPYITITKNKTPISKHVDLKKDDERYKIGVYLNDIKKGGTVFYINDTETYEIEHKKGRLIMFDVKIPHKGGDIEKGDVKYMIGIRVK